jgi:hypothetical protein
VRRREAPLAPANPIEDDRRRTAPATDKIGATGASSQVEVTAPFRVT